ncbi:MULTISPECIES: GGDEF domain-containing protein [Deinococcus]|uniref:GGDEF domain-containing protein n=1 Tax=Deinococcus rufus TaxID=2136097 RepID=A0ABV7Z3S3_9DEIO|nr:GGDEF domain-containing protein [Deinococcus sp. AB2017081]WQE95265.1 GGDEF domain-containing protein [Deinococcus sp. AB2017081]
MKLVGYAFAALAATPGLLLLLRELVMHRAWLQVGTHGVVLLGAALLLVWGWRQPRRIPQAERIFAGLLVVSAVSFLQMYAAHPEQIVGRDLLGSVLLFIVTGLLLILPSRLSIPLSLLLLGAYRLEVNLLSGIDRDRLLVSQWVNTGMFALLVVGVVMRQTLAGLTERLHVLEELSNRDPLTGLFNRRGFEAQARLQRTGDTAGTLLVLDIDHFKVVNDTHGHAEGDRILTELGTQLLRVIPPGTLTARWGGEEFVVYLHGHDVLNAAAVADTVRAAAQHTLFGHVAITVSIGVASWPTDDTLHHAFLHADEALYTAKREGRNRVWVAGQTAPVQSGSAG